MNTQDKIDILKDYVKTCGWIEEPHPDIYVEENGYTMLKNAKQWLLELEQSNNKDNIDNWSNRELFDYCVENKLLPDNFEKDFKSINNLYCRTFMIQYVLNNKAKEY